MNIKQAEELTGVSRQNIRFYEREGLLTPDRNPDNDYREYNEDHIRVLKQIRILRMLDMPLEKIRMLLNGKLTLSQAAQEQEVVLKQQQEQLAAAIRFCEELKGSSLEELNTDVILDRMNHPENTNGFFLQWLSDYRKVVLSEREKTFTFIPDEPIRSPGEFTNALFAYANESNLDLVVISESMSPVFTINGIDYKASCYYRAVQGIPTAIVRCTVMYPEDFEPDVPDKRKRYMKLLNLGWLLIPFVLMNLVWMLNTNWKDFFSQGEGWLASVGIAAAVFSGLYLTWLYHFNEKH